MKQTLEQTNTTKAELIELGKYALSELMKIRAKTGVEFSFDNSSITQNNNEGITIHIVLYDADNYNATVRLYNFHHINFNTEKLKKAIEAIRDNSLEEMRKIDKGE